MLQIPLCTSTTLLSPASFWNSILIYHGRPHLVNRKLLGASEALVVRALSIKPSKLHLLITASAVLYETRRLKELASNAITKDFLLNILEPYCKDVTLRETTCEELASCEDGIYISIRILLPRLKGLEKCVEIAVLDKGRDVATFLAVAELGKVAPAPTFRYSVQRETTGALRICVDSFEDADTGSAEWLSSRLFGKLLKWADDEVVRNVQPSLSLVSVERHVDLYSRLKETYGAQIVKVSVLFEFILKRLNDI